MFYTPPYQFITILLERSDMTVKAMKAEAEYQPTVFTYDGVEYTFPDQKLWPLAAIEAQENNHIVALIKSLLGAEQYAKFTSKPRVLNDIADFFEAAGKEAGAVPGK